MSNIIRMRAQAESEDYFRNLYEQYGGIPENHQLAIDMRMQFFNKYILSRSTSDYLTPVEKDWAYVAKREYRYDVNIRAATDGAAAGLTACMLRMFMVKKFVMWPFLPVMASVGLYRSQQLFVLHQKKFFDMCNVGEQYELGYARNVVLRTCNALIDREDF